MLAIDPAQRLRYEEDGFIILRQAFPTHIVAPLLEATGRSALSVVDRHGNKQELNTWTWCGDDLIGRFPRIDPLVDLAAQLIGDDVYHWHSKISWKKPHSAGTWDWHQDYSFWMKEGCALPAMTTISVALDSNDVDNGCLHVVKGSHRLGDIEHVPTGHGRAAEQSAVDAAIEKLEMVPIELEPGDVVAFHCNTLHTSGPNTSDRPRTLLHCSYNGRSNAASDPWIDGHQLNDLERVPWDQIQPGTYDAVFGDTAFITPENSGYGGRDGYVVQAGSR